MDYGSIFYMSAAKTTLHKLDTLQNSCLRIIIGAMRSSPTVSLEVESNIPPLYIHRIFTLLKYYFRLTQLPTNKFLLAELFTSNQTSYHLGWTSTIRSAPVIVRSRQALMQVQFPFGDTSPAPLLSPLPPWVNMEPFLITEFASCPIKLLSPQQCYNIFNHLCNTKYKSICPHIYRWICTLRGATVNFSSNSFS